MQIGVTAQSAGRKQTLHIYIIYLLQTKLLRIAILDNNCLMTIFPYTKSLLLILLYTYSDLQHIIMIAKICFRTIVYPFHLPKSRTLSICSQLAFEYHCYAFSNFNLRNEIIKM